MAGSGLGDKEAAGDSRGGAGPLLGWTRGTHFLTKSAEIDLQGTWSLWASIKNSTKGFCEILSGIYQARHFKLISCGFSCGFSKTAAKKYIIFLKLVIFM